MYDNNMHGERIKVVNAKQARQHNNFKNTKCKLLRTNAAIWFNKMCRIRQIKSNYINIRINGWTVHNKTDSREVHMTTTQIEDTATYPSKIVTKQQGGKQHCTRNIP